MRKSIDLGGFCITIQGAIFVRELDKEFEAGICLIVMDDTPRLGFTPCSG